MRVENHLDTITEGVVVYKITSNTNVAKREELKVSRNTEVDNARV